MMQKSAHGKKVLMLIVIISLGLSGLLAESEKEDADEWIEHYGI